MRYVYCILIGTPEYSEKCVLDSQEQDYYKFYTLVSFFECLLLENMGNPVTILAACNCTFSNCSISDCVNLSQTLEAYSSSGLIYKGYIHMRKCLSPYNRFKRFFKGFINDSVYVIWPTEVIR